MAHTIEVTTANEHNVTVASKLIREDDEVVYGDSRYLGSKNRKIYKQTRIWHPSTIESTLSQEFAEGIR